MKNSKMLLGLVASITTVPVGAVTNPHVVHIGEHASVRISTNDTRENGNIFHEMIKNYGDKNFKFSLTMDVYPFAFIEEMEAGIQQSPYNQLPKILARQAYVENKYANLNEDVQEEVQENLRALLAGKDDEGKTYIDLLKEKSADNAIFADIAKSCEASEQELKEALEKQEPKEVKLERRAREQKEREELIAFAAFMINKQ